MLAERFPSNIALQNLMGATSVGLGNLQDAVDRFNRVLEMAPGDVGTLNNLGNAHMQMGNVDEALDSYRSAIVHNPEHAVAHTNLGNALKAARRWEEAIASFQRAIEIKPELVDAHSNLGTVFKNLGDINTAVACYQHAINLNPSHPEANYNMALALHLQGKTEESIPFFQRAIQAKPVYADAFFGLGSSLARLGKLDIAIASFRKVLELSPNHPAALSQLVYQRARICDWTAVDIDTKGLGVETDPVAPFRLLAVEDAPERHLLRSQAYTQLHFPSVISREAKVKKEKPERLRIGYFSEDFRDHAVMFLAARVFELHDRQKFTIHAYSYGPDKRDGMRTRLEDSMDSFKVVRDKSDREIVEMARRDGLDIAVDLAELTGDARLGIFANRVAPVQMTWLGYPGTTGADFMGYIVADPVVIPEEAGSHYSEAVLYLPHAYQPNNDQRPISERVFTRSELDLPEDGFVFCCFNNSYKITAQEFDVWAPLLARVEGSVLWLLKSNQWAEANLRSELANRGIDPARLVFAETMPLADHLARHRCADLFLDTFNYNAHTTASDALWAGLPLITKQGKGFAARVASSLLTAVNLEELITHSEEAYEQLALELALSPEKIAAVRKKLAVNRNSGPLFNSELFTRHIERAYVAAYGRHLEGKPPATIHIDD